MANDALKAIATAIDNNEVAEILPVEPDVFMSYSDLFEFVKDYYTKHSTAPTCLLYTSPSPRDRTRSRMPSSA